MPGIAAALTPRGCDRLIEQLQLCLSGQNTLIPVFHLVRNAILQRSHGFTVAFTGLEDDTPHDLLLKRHETEAKVTCDVITAEEGRGVHRGAWFRLADHIDPDLQTWVAAHPGRYLLKMTIPLGLRGRLHDADPETETLGRLHQRIRNLLETKSRHDYNEAIVLRLDPLLLAGAQVEDTGLVSSPAAGVWTGAAPVGDDGRRRHLRDGRPRGLRERGRNRHSSRRLAALAPARLTGEQPGILSIFVEDINRLE